MQSASISTYGKFNGDHRESAVTCPSRVPTESTCRICPRLPPPLSEAVLVGTCYQQIISLRAEIVEAFSRANGLYLGGLHLAQWPWTTTGRNCPTLTSLYIRALWLQGLF